MAGGQISPLRSRLLLDALLHHKLLIVALGLVAAMAGIAAGYVLPQSYVSSATVLIIPLSGNPYSPEGRGDDLINLASETQLVTADSVVAKVAAQLREPDVTAVRKGVDVQVPTNTQTLEITFTGDDPEQARKGATAFATTYLAFRRQRSEAILDDKIAELSAQAKKVDASLQKATTELASNTLTAARRNYLTHRLTQLSNQLAVLDEQSNDLASTPVSPGQIISSATVPSESELSDIGIFGAGGLAAGLTLGLAAAMLRERRRDRLRDAHAVAAMGVPVLAVFDEPALPSAPLDPETIAGRGTRALRTAVITRATQPRPTVLIAGVSSQDPSARPFALLAAALGSTGARTVAIDAGYGAEPSASELFGLDGNRGLSEALDGGEPPEELVTACGDALAVLPQGADLTAAHDRLPGPRLLEIVNRLRQEADYVLVNGPALADPDGRAVSVIADYAVVVVRAQVTRRRDVLEAYLHAQQSDIELLGAVVVSPPTRAAARAARRALQAGHTPPATSWTADQIRTEPERAAVPPPGVPAEERMEEPAAKDTSHWEDPHRERDFWQESPQESSHRETSRGQAVNGEAPPRELRWEAIPQETAYQETGYQETAYQEAPAREAGRHPETARNERRLWEEPHRDGAPQQSAAWEASAEEDDEDDEENDDSETVAFPAITDAMPAKTGRSR